MPWVRLGDTALTHPVVMTGALVSGADGRTRNELFGFVALLATISAAHPTDAAVVEVAAVYMVGGSETDRLVRQAVEAGYLAPCEVDGRQAWRLINDARLVHIRTAAEVERDRTRKTDAGNVDVTLAVQRRDGSQCRYCGRTVSWTDKTGGRGGTYDHRDPDRLVSGQPAETPDDLVVACRGCNSSRGVAFRDGRLAEWDAAHPMRPVPVAPHYCEHVRARLIKHGVALQVERPADPDTAPAARRPGSQPGTAGRGVRPGPADTAPTHTGPNGESQPENMPLNMPTGELAKGGKVNSPGRVGQGRAEQGRAGTGGRPARRRRGRRSPRGDPPA